MCELILERYHKNMFKSTLTRHQAHLTMRETTREWFHVFKPGELYVK